MSQLEEWPMQSNNFNTVFIIVSFYHAIWTLQACVVTIYKAIVWDSLGWDPTLQNQSLSFPTTIKSRYSPDNESETYLL